MQGSKFKRFCAVFSVHEEELTSLRRCGKTINRFVNVQSYKTSKADRMKTEMKRQESRPCYLLAWITPLRWIVLARLTSDYACNFLYSMLMVAANGRDIVTAVVKVVAFYITVAARVSLAFVSCTASIICCTACSLVSGWAIVGLVELVLYLFSLFITPTSIIVSLWGVWGSILPDAVGVGTLLIVVAEGYVYSFPVAAVLVHWW